MTEPSIPKLLDKLDSRSVFDRMTSLRQLLTITQESTEEEDRVLSPILKDERGLSLLIKSLLSTDSEEHGLALTVCTNLSAGEENGSMFFEDGRLLPEVMKVLQNTTTETESQLRDISMLCLANLSVNSSHTTRMVDHGVLPLVLKSFQSAKNGLEKQQAIKALSYISQDAIIRDQILTEWAKISPDVDLKKASNLVIRSVDNAAEAGNVLEILRNLDILRDWVKPGKPFYDTSEFPFCKMLEEKYPIILKEFEALQAEHLVSWPEKYLCKKGWDVFGLYAFNNRLEENCAKCPETAKILASIPGMTTAMFSCLQPRTHIRPHIGYFQYSNYILRAHLGIKVPQGTALKVNGTEQTWENGKTFVFDDTFRHEAYNKSNEMRVVLMIDFKYEGNPNDRNPAFQAASPTIPGGADEALVSPALMAKLSEFVTPQNCKRQDNTNVANA